ncbi:AccI family restriction endonuclease [Rhodopseudomonas sp. P1]|uniref:AccI family restriction endonuclease n=1 Tax=Rhodopseudomonas sp. P1 TaxID=3434357 RepID=UPI0031FC2E11
MTYVARLKNAALACVTVLRRIGVDDKFLCFDGRPSEPGRIFVPSQSDSKFQAEQALGDWAEDAVADAINSSSMSLKAVHYGFNSKLFAEDEGFKEEYVSGVEDTYKNGKRADLLLFAIGSDVPELTALSSEQAKPFVRQSVGALEVRSSRLNARQYIAYQERRLKDGKKPTSLEPNFTVKVEDLIKVYLWIVLNKKPQAYVQVFFDEVWGIGFLQIMELIASGAKLRVEKHKRSSKTTIMVPLSNGMQIGQVVEQPTFTLVHNITKNGRHDIFAKPQGGEIQINDGQLVSLLR